MGRNNQENLRKKITIGDVADALGVSKTTVSRVISGKGRIGSETKERVLEYIKLHDYKPNVIAKGLAQSKTFNIGIMLPGDYNLNELPFFQSCLMGICDVASSMDYDTLVSIVSEHDISQLKRVVYHNKVDGIILTRTLVNDQSMEFLRESGKKFVTIGSSLEDDVIQVDNDHKEACKELTSILLMTGMKRVALIGGDLTHVVTKNRYQGYLDAFQDKGMIPDGKLIYMDVKSSVVCERIVEDILNNQADCIICMDDCICGYVLNKLRKDHIKIPEDIRIASFYNSTLLENNRPSVTSLNFDSRELGRVACKTLLDYMDDKEVKNRNLLGYEVVLKESTKG